MTQNYNYLIKHENEVTKVSMEEGRLGALSHTPMRINILNIYIHICLCNIISIRKKTLQP